MIEQLSSEVSPFILTLLLKYKYLVLFPILVVEGPIVTILSGALATPEAHVFSIVPLFFFVVFADLFGDTFYYLIGRYAGEKVLNRISEKKHVDYHQKITDYFEKYGGRTLIIGKISHGLGWPVMVFAGSVHMNYARFMTFNLFTSLIKSIVLILIGYLYSENYRQIVSYFGSVSATITITALVVLLIYLFVYSRKVR
ncbi:MAG: DedA family protein [Patescibacteria group bacterium]